MADRIEDEARAFRLRIEALRDQPSPQELARLEEDMLGFFAGPRGENRRRLLAMGRRFERAADGFDQARCAPAEGRTEYYLAALDVLAEWCPP